MENKEQTDSSSFTADLFGADKSPPSTGIFASLFPPPSTAMGRNYASSELRGSMQKQPAGSQAFGYKQGTQDNVDKNAEGASHKGRKSIFQERVGPCPLSSSLYYGGQEDMYIKSSSAQTPESYPIGRFIIKTLPSQTHEYFFYLLKEIHEANGSSVILVFVIHNRVQ